jgi:hypothetical protein
MAKRVAICLTVFLLLSPAFPQQGAGPGSSEILKRLDDISRRLNQIEQDIKQLRAAVRGTEGQRNPPEGEGPAMAPEGDPRELWQAMGNPAELAKRLDMLVGLVVPTLPEETTREEFKKDVEALKEKIGRKISEEELSTLVRERFSERMKVTTNEKEKAWLQSQVDILDKSQGEARREMLDRFVRMQNIRDLHELGRKYSIEREQMVKCRLAFVGYRGRPPGEPRHPEDERRPGRRPRGTSGPPAEENRR